jgi:hypothetical protein
MKHPQQPIQDVTEAEMNRLRRRLSPDLLEVLHMLEAVELRNCISQDHAALGDAA